MVTEELLPPDPPEMHDELLEALEMVYEWYDDVLPARLNSMAFPRFVTRSRKIMDYVKEDLPLKFDVKATTAYTDGVSVTIPAVFLMPEFYDAYGIHSDHHAAAAALLINGCQGHEALHCRITPFDMIKFAEFDPTGEALTLMGQYKGFKDALNVVEDVFIESHGRHFYRGVSGFVDGKNEIILGPYALQGVIDQIEAEGGTGYSPEAMIGLVAFNKNLVTRHNPLLVERVGPLLDITDAANNPHLKPAERLSIAKELFWAIFDAAGGEAGAEGSEFMKSPLPGEGESPNGELSEMDRDQMLKELAEALGEAMAKAGMTEADVEAMLDRLESEIVEAKVEAERLAMEEKEELEKPKDATRDKVHVSADWLESLAKPVIKDVLQEREAYEANARPSVEWARLGQHLRMLREEKFVPGKATDTGGRIQKRLLSAIATTGKVLAKRERTAVVRGKPEVVILVDASGSMRGHQGLPGDSSLFISTVNAALGMFEALMRATISVSVYAHTSTGQSPLVMSVAAFRMPVFGMMAVTTGNYVERFNRLAKVRCIENFDGVAIETVGDQFTTTPGSKVLVVLSDGAPSAPGYGGRSGYNHTRLAVQNIRRQGRHVISVSLVESVVNTNNEIYGKDYNLPAFGAGMVQSLQELAGRLAIPAS